MVGLLRTNIVCGLILSLSLIASAQTESAAGLAIDTKESWTLRRGWKLNAGGGIEWRPYFSSSETLPMPTPLRNVDLNLGIERRWLEFWRFGTGIRLRTRYPFGGDASDSDPQAREFRSWWYATRSEAYGYTTFQQRFRVEQRFRSRTGESLELTHRFRYQLGVERALQGLELDPGEWYGVASFEVLASTDKFCRKPESIDFRPYLGAGKNKYELGLEYRHERSGASWDGLEQAFLLVLQWDF